MSNIFQDMVDLYGKYGFLDEPMTLERLQFRIMNLQQEELDELKQALEDGNAEEIVDALVDTIVIAAGTLIMLDVDADRAWVEVLRANNQKARGVKSTRPNSKGFDLTKPTDWKPPSHEGNHGDLSDLL